MPAQVAWRRWLLACSAAQSTLRWGPAAVFVACAGSLGLAMLIMIAAIAWGVFVPVPKITR
jgi:hypothetical protein